MDQNRQIRFLVPPFVFILSLLWGAHLSGIDLRKVFGEDIVKSIVGLLAAGAVTAIGLGFIVSTISLNILRLIFSIFGKKSYEAVPSDATLQRIWKQLKTDLPFDRDLSLFADATFDHELVSPGIHEWVARRWSSFNISIHSCFFLILAHAIAPFLSINQSIAWGITSTIFGISFLINAIFAWREKKEMIDFQSYRNHPHINDIKNKKTK